MEKPAIGGFFRYPSFPLSAVIRFLVGTIFQPSRVSVSSTLQLTVL